ncbi:ATP-dependent helicase [Nakamurella deserti]|uniref:ATP-dependent helicase n=1 Tax=Nakamurella deserti TaxID=2164074 RepID=UPI000DBE6D0B|nr:UvrD-helicase domain-containing protein [Nakamurella deserti]
MTVRWSAVELSRALGQPHPPTPEQIAVIEAPLEPLLVVAGAGSGKTETMAARVVYLVANGLVAPEHVLGLTFTRKAAAQLLHRIRQRLAQLPETFESEPQVLTYHAFGGRLLGEYGALVGIEPQARVLTPTSSWQLASSVVRRWDSDLDTDLPPDLVTERLLQLSGVLADHLRTPGELADATDELAGLIADAPPAARQRNALHTKLVNLHARLTNRHGILPLVGAYSDAKQRTSSLDFGDQIQLAADLVARHPRVGEEIRDRYRVVLLDEYQDTGHAQRIILRGLFGSGSGRRGHPVTAVGDPCQSIYGWRGAAASNLPRFTTDFPSSDGTPAARASLLTSFRNPSRVLTIANAVSAPVRAEGIPVDELQPRAGAAAGDVRYGLFETVNDEDVWVADTIAAHWQAALDTGQRPPTTAVLFRRRSSIAPLAAALTARGVPVEVPGLAGLLSEPEVAEVVSVLRVLVDPTAGNAAVRVLTGARWAIGLADVTALQRRAGVLTGRRAAGAGARLGRDSVHEAIQQAVTDDIEYASLLDALADPGPAADYSPAGHDRIRRLGAELDRLRRRLSMPLTDLVVEIERQIGLDVEVALARGRGRANLDAFAEVVADFVSGGGGRSVPADADEIAGMRTGQALDLLSFLDVAADREEGLELTEIEQDGDAVQLVTVHAAKGLEWELVAVPHLAQGVFPSARSSTWLTDDSYLPPHLRGDHLDLPVLDLPPGADQGAIAAAVEKHKEDWKSEQLVEERRLLYVALTRAEHTLLMSSHWWSRTTAKPRGPSEFFTEVLPAIGGEAVQWVSAPTATENPLTEISVTGSWPVDPLGTRRPAVEEGAQLVRLAQHFAPPVGLGQPAALPGAAADPDGWDRDVDALLAERRAARERRQHVPLPDSVSVSALVAMASDPGRLARQLRRPVPQPPAIAARRGTAFHSWLEHHYAGDALLDIDELPGSDDRDALPDEMLDVLREAFLASPWAARTPHAQEVSFSTVIDDLPVRGRIDAIFADADGGWTVIDWKTGRVPVGDATAAVSVQLAVYRLAWAELSGSPLDQVRAAFHYVAEGVTVAPSDLLGAADLVAMIRNATSAEPTVAADVAPSLV